MGECEQCNRLSPVGSLHIGLSLAGAHVKSTPQGWCTSAINEYVSRHVSDHRSESMIYNAR
jgi:hypothetical protein